MEKEKAPGNVGLDSSPSRAPVKFAGDWHLQHRLRSKPCSRTDKSRRAKERKFEHDRLRYQNWKSEAVGN